MMTKDWEKYYTNACNEFAEKENQSTWTHSIQMPNQRMPQLQLMWATIHNNNQCSTLLYGDEKNCNGSPTKLAY